MSIHTYAPSQRFLILSAFIAFVTALLGCGGGEPLGQNNNSANSIPENGIRLVGFGPPINGINNPVTEGFDTDGDGIIDVTFISVADNESIGTIVLSLSGGNSGTITGIGESLLETSEGFINFTGTYSYTPNEPFSNGTLTINFDDFSYFLIESASRLELRYTNVVMTVELTITDVSNFNGSYEGNLTETVESFNSEGVSISDSSTEVNQVTGSF